MTETTNIQTLNPFGAAPAAQSAGGALQNAEQARSVAEVQAALLIARMNPRDQRVAMDRILNACTRPSLAESAIYSYARGGSNITGPSIRLAEAIAQQWGNLQFGIRELSSKNGVSEVQAFAWDVETNTRREITFSVPHIRYTRKGGYKLEDPRDIYELIANQGARRLRACILAVIPGDVVEAAVQQCSATLQSHVDVTPEGIKKMLSEFKDKFGVEQSQIEKFCQCRAQAIKPAQVVRLRGIFASLRDGMSSPEDWFEPVEKKAAADAKPAKKSLKEKLKEKAAAEKAEEEKKASELPAPEEEPVATDAAGVLDSLREPEDDTAATNAVDGITDEDVPY
jgi:hypothetical protein